MLWQRHNLSSPIDMIRTHHSNQLREMEMARLVAHIMRGSFWLVQIILDHRMQLTTNPTESLFSTKLVDKRLFLCDPLTQQQRVTMDQHWQSILFFAAYVSSTFLRWFHLIREAWPACCALFPSTLCNEPGIEALPQVNNIEICKSFKLFIKGVQQNFCPHSKSGS